MEMADKVGKHGKFLCVLGKCSKYTATGLPGIMEGEVKMTGWRVRVGAG